MIFLLLSFSSTSCSDESSKDGIIPSIGLAEIEKIKDIQGRDSLLILSISYVDADGDIGLESFDTLPPFNPGGPFQYNFLIDIKELKNGNQKPITQPGSSDPENFNQRIPNLTPTGRNRHIEGEISVRLDATPNYLYPDTLVCSLQLIDRSFHESNVVETGIIVLKH
jgi:hypothetical protein